MTTELGILNQFKNVTSTGDVRNLFGSMGYTGAGDDFVNSVFSLVQEGQNVANGSDKQTAINNILNNILSVISSIGTNESAVAAKEVKNDSKATDNLDKNVKQTESETKTKLEKIMTAVSEGTVSIENAIEKLQELGGDDGLIAQVQEQLKEQLDIIDTNKEILNNGVSSPDAKQEAFDNIKKASDKIQKLVSSLNKIVKLIEKQNKIVTKASEKVELNVNDAANVFAESEEKLGQFTQQVQTQAQNISKSQTQGQIDEKISEVARDTSTETSWIPVAGQAASADLIKISVDRALSSQTRLIGSAQNMQALSSTITSLGSAFGEFQSVMGNIGNMTDIFVTRVGSYNDTISPYITAIGTWTTANSELQQTVTEYQKQAFGDESKHDWSNQGKDNKEPQMQNFVEFKFDRKSFGI